MDELQFFKNEQFGEVRVINKNGEPWFVAKDISDALGYSETNAMTKRLDKEDFISDKLEGMNMKSTLINESGFYAAILGSEKPEAKQFKRWVTSEVLPSIRKHGAYMTEQTIEKALTSPDFLIQLASKLKEEQQKNKILEEEKKVLEPKAQFYDDVAGSKDAIEMGHVAKVVNIKGYGRNNLFEFLRNMKVLDKNNVPYQKYVDLGYFRVLEQKYNVPTGDVKINIKTLVFQKGVDFIIKLIKSA